MTDTNREVIFSIVLVNYNSGSLLKDCLSSILENLTADFEIIVYDNASTDDSVLKVRSVFPSDLRIRIIEGNVNLGFAKANNLGAQAAKGRYLHFLNPDIIVNNSLSEDYAKIQKGSLDTVYVTSLTDQNGKPSKNRHVIPTLKNFYNLILNTRKVMFWNIGASIIISRETFRILGGWPEDYFMYAEDIDIFYRIQKQGIHVSYLDTRLIHIGQGTTRNLWDDRERALRVERSFLKFYRKYGMGWQYYLIRPVLLVFILFHEHERFLLQLKTYLRIVFSRNK
jgi:GT2 family glycosyltransferase